MQSPEIPAGDAARAPAQAIAMAVLAVLFWASAIVVGRYIQAAVPAVGLTFWRCLLATVILLPFAWRHLRTDAPAIRQHWKRLALLSAAMWTVGSTSMFLGLHFTGAVNAGLVNATEPAFIVLFAWLLYRDTVSPRQAAGIVISFCGVAILIIGGHEGDTFALGPRIGDLLVLLAVWSWSLYIVWFHRFGNQLHPMTMVFMTAALAVPELLPFYLMESLLLRPVPLNLSSIISITYLAVAASILAVMCWNRAILGMGAARTGLYVHLMPVFTVVLAIIFLGEGLHLYHLAGIVPIGLGLWLTTTGRRA